MNDVDADDRPDGSGPFHRLVARLSGETVTKYSQSIKDGLLHAGLIVRLRQLVVLPLVSHFRLRLPSRVRLMEVEEPGLEEVSAVILDEEKPLLWVSDAVTDCFYPLEVVDDSNC